MAVHEITERPDGIVEEYHSFTAEEWADFADRPQIAGAMEHRQLRSTTPAVVDPEDRTVRALSVVLAVAQHDPRFRLEAR